MRRSGRVRATARARLLRARAVAFSASTATSRAIERACATNASASAHRSAFVSTITGSTCPCRATVRYRSRRDRLKSSLHDVTTNSVSRFAAIACMRCSIPAAMREISERRSRMRSTRGASRSMSSQSPTAMAASSKRDEAARRRRATPRSHEHGDETALNAADARRKARAQIFQGELLRIEGRPAEPVERKRAVHCRARPAYCAAWRSCRHRSLCRTPLSSCRRSRAARSS